MTTHDHDDDHHPLRIVCLIPSATDICIALGLKDSIVGITHECHIQSDDDSNHNDQDKNNNNNHNDTNNSHHNNKYDNSNILIVTSDGLHNYINTTTTDDKSSSSSLSQSQINQAVVRMREQQQDQQSNTTCTTTTKNIDNNDNGDNKKAEIAIPSLYPIDYNLLSKCQPNIIITQDLCDVCAPTSDVIVQWMKQQKQQHEQQERQDNNSDNNEEETSSSNKYNNNDNNIQILSLSPNTIHEIANTFVQIATVCNIPLKGIQLRNVFLDQFQQIYEIIKNNYNNKEEEAPPRRRMLLLEWLDPPYDCGHWIPELMRYANIEPIFIKKDNDDDGDTNNDEHMNSNTEGSITNQYKKSQCITWDNIKKQHYNNIDIVVIASCGMDLQRNIEDGMKIINELERCCQPAYDLHNIYAINSNKYIVNPSPYLVDGCIMLTMIAYHDNPMIMEQIQNLSFVKQQTNKYNELMQGWKRLPIDTTSSSSPSPSSLLCAGANIPDIEDIATNHYPNDDDNNNNNNHIHWDIIHQQSCNDNQFFYIDPNTGYHVFTELQHIKRGYCCGSGCRHCPYHHMNIKLDIDKVNKIQQPSFLYMNHYNNNNFEENKTTKSTTNNNNNEHNDQHQLFALPSNDDDKSKNCCDLYVLFFSGGKDSFLAIRAIVRKQMERLQQQKDQPNTQIRNISLILLTTFDATSRMIAHQDISMHDVMKQAKHLNISLIGVPLHRKSTISYIERLNDTFHYIEKEMKCPISTIVFGDLHLQTIIEWRKNEFNKLLSSILPNQTYQLLFPLCNIDYNILEQDLDKSQVPCYISSTTLSTNDFPYITVGVPYEKDLRKQIKRNNNNYNDLATTTTTSGSSSNDSRIQTIDLFGENGEFHTIVKVWEVSREIALGL